MIPAGLPGWLPPDPRKRRGIAVALLVFSILLIVAVVAVPAVLLHRHYDESIARLSRQVSTQTVFNALRPRLMEKLELLKKRDVKKLFLKGTSPALALAELQEIVRATIEANGGRVGGSSVPGSVAKDDGPYRTVVATFNLTASGTNLRRVLYALETKEPYLFVDIVTVQSQVGSGYRPPPGSAEPDVVVQQLEVRAYALRAASETVPQVSAAGSQTPAAVKGSGSDAASKNKGGAT